MLRYMSSTIIIAKCKSYNCNLFNHQQPQMAILALVYSTYVRREIQKSATYVIWFK